MTYTANLKVLKLASIPEDIIIDILVRLPVKSLLRFKSICKTWYHLIKSPTFISMHHNCLTPSQLLICKRDRSKKARHVFSFLSNDKSTRVLSPDLDLQLNYWPRIVGSCNGIICYCDIRSTIFLCNPATREFKQLPASPFQHLTNLLCNTSVGFGFDTSNIYDFKVIRLLPGNPTKTCEIFTLSSNTWRQIDWVMEDNGPRKYRPALFYANSFLWIAEERKYPRLETIICFDIHTERFKKMDMPRKDGLKTLVSWEWDFQLMVFQGFLSSVAISFRSGENSLVIWIMKDYGDVESWTKLYHIQSSTSQFFAPICFLMNDLYLLLMETYGNKLSLCHLNTLDLEGIEIDGVERYSHSAKCVVYTETLVSIM